MTLKYLGMSCTNLIKTEREIDKEREMERSRLFEGVGREMQSYFKSWCCCGNVTANLIRLKSFREKKEMVGGKREKPRVCHLAAVY